MPDDHTDQTQTEQAKAAERVRQQVIDALELFLPIVCVSASKHIEEGVERRSAGFAYVQGSGDDHELWGEVRTDTTNCSIPQADSFLGAYT